MKSTHIHFKKPADFFFQKRGSVVIREGHYQDIEIERSLALDKGNMVFAKLIY